MSIDSIDLHIHSDASDGTLSPAQILETAGQLRLSAIAITDHDTVAGSKKAIEVGIPPSIDFLTGIEISASPPPDFPCSGSFHILGYGLRLDDPVLNHSLATFQEARKERNPRILRRLDRMGMHISRHELENSFGKSQIGRPHIARLMIKKGFVSSVDEAFDKYLSRGKPAYADKYRAACDEAIRIILDAGGIPVLAHPFLLNPLNDTPLENLIRTLRNMGLKGIEVCYPEHSPEHTALYTELAGRYDLLMTGGTDFHGTVRPGIQMGFGRGDFSVPRELYEKLIAP